jgi:peptidoglycan/xylan/chitin deacetylase (PgdA/CDA1 family)
MRRLYPAIALLIALAAAAGAWQALHGRSRPDKAAVSPPAAKASAHRADIAEAATNAPIEKRLAPVPAVPAAYRGKILRQRVRHFPDKLLALTFDDGPSPTVTPRVLKTLREHHAHATFFVLGNCAKRWPALVRQAAREGHAIGSHSYSHPSKLSPAQACSQLERTAALIEAATGQRPRLFRPPYGITKGNLCQTALQQGYTAVLWTISSADSRPIGHQVIAHNVIHTPNPGDIVLMHDAENHAATAEALPQILTELAAAGFRFVTIPELLQAWEQWRAQHKVVADAQGTPHHRP